MWVGGCGWGVMGEKSFDGTRTMSAHADTANSPAACFAVEAGKKDGLEFVELFVCEAQVVEIHFFTRLINLLADAACACKLFCYSHRVAGVGGSGGRGGRGGRGGGRGVWQGELQFNMHEVVICASRISGRRVVESPGTRTARAKQRATAQQQRWDTHQLSFSDKKERRVVPGPTVKSPWLNSRMILLA